MSPGAVATVDRAVAIHEKRGEREVVIELKQRKVERVGVDDAGENILKAEFAALPHGDGRAAGAAAGRSRVPDRQHAGRADAALWLDGGPPDEPLRRP